jgi:peptidyl-dipeptidase Dcp
MTESKLPYGVPDFTKIKDSDFRPAMEAGRKQQIGEISEIANNSEAPTFENTIVAMEKTGQTLNRVMSVFNLLSSANTDPELQKIGEEEASAMAAQSDAIYLNDKLFARIKALYEKRDSLSLDNESLKLLQNYYKDFCMAGANLSSSDKEKLKKINGEIASLGAKFSNSLIAAAKAGALVVEDSSKLDGLSREEINAAALKAKENGMPGKYMIPLQNTTQQPDLQYLKNREVRRHLFEKSWTRAEKGDCNDTRKIILRIASLRAQKSALLGYKNYAEWNLQDQMAENAETVQKFLNKLVPATTARARMEANEIQKVIDGEKGGFKLQPWDWNYYAEKLRKAKYNLNESEIKPYFQLYNVLEKGVFYAANKLYGLTFKQRSDIPVYQKDMRVYEVFNEDSTAVGLFICDYFKRDNKAGGAWMDNLIQQSRLLNHKPVIYNVCNFAKPAPGQPALISFDDVTTMFHEFGHALHGFFADQEYPTLSGTNVARDFVEFPSQFNEHWASYPQVLKNYAINYKTGKSMPQSLVDKIKKSAEFNQGYFFTEILAASELDMQWHMISASDTVKDVDEFEKEALHKTGLDIPQVPPRYRSSYFLHIWENGYAAGYYAYVWTEMLDDDAFAWFEDHGGLTRANGQRFRDMILSRGNTEDYGEMYRNFTGRDPRIEPLLKARGLK